MIYIASSILYWKLMKIMREESQMGGIRINLRGREGPRRNDQGSMVTWEGYLAKIASRGDWDHLLTRLPLSLKNRNSLRYVSL